jgi:O-antigen/teichoic acid export membrane protein
MFIVLPKLTQFPEIYGIYTVCISVVIYYSYADIGFISAGFKYASECYSRNDLIEEIKLTSFSTFILALFVALISLVIVTFAIRPSILINNLTDTNHLKIASQLLWIVVLFSVVNVGQRAIQNIFAIRLQDYIYQKIFLFISSIRIASVLYFFRSGNYDITGFFLFTQSLSAIGVLCAAFIAFNKFNYDFKEFFKHFRFSMVIYKKIKDLAFSSLFITVAWILFYELDTFAIAKISGPKAVASYAIGLIVLSFFRTLIGILYSPYVARFNHYVGQKNFIGLKEGFYNSIILTLPILLFPVLIVFFLAKPFVFSWLGPNYSSSIQILQFLILSNILGFISNPTSLILLSLEKIKDLYLTSALLPIIFWGGIIATYSIFNILSFAIFKFISYMCLGIVCTKITKDFLEIDTFTFLKGIIRIIIIPITVLVILSSVGYYYLPATKSKLNVFIILVFGFFVFIISSILYYKLSGLLKKYSSQIVTNYPFMKIILN